MTCPTRLALAALTAGLSLAACAKPIDAPTNRGVCWHAVPLKNHQIRFNQLSINQPNLESCAGSLEAMRLRFLGIGGANDEIMGAYQGNFLFLQHEGVFTSQSLTGSRYLMMVRTGDGRLAVPGVMPQPQSR
jgi:hypothetical protein